MANNSMFLVHVPTGLAVKLGKRMSYGWYTAGLGWKVGSHVALLFAELEKIHYGDGSQDDFAVALEDVEGATLATGKWNYGPKRDDGLVQLVMNMESGSIK